MGLDIERLKYFLAAAENRSFRQTADIFDVHQSTISRAVRQLEDSIGVSLFERSHSGIRLTQAGRHFMHETQMAVEHLEAAKRSAEAAGRAELGKLRIGILTSLAGGFLRQLIHNYASTYPDVAIDVRDGGRRDHFAAIRAHRLDVAFVTGIGPVEGCDTAELWRERVHVAMSGNHPLAHQRRLDWPQLKNECFIVSRMEPGPEVHDYIVRRVADYSTYPQIEQKAALQETLMHLVAMGQGITLVSAAWNSLKFPGLVLRPLTARADIVPFSAVWSPGNDNPVLRRFLSVCHVLAAVAAKGLPIGSQ